MNQRFLAITSAMLGALSFAAVQASAKPAAANMRDPQARLMQVKNLANETADVANQLYLLDTHPETDWRIEIPKLESMKYNINRIGKDLQALQAKRDLMSPAERQAFDKSLPLFRDAAANTQNAILYMNHHQRNFWMSTNLGYAEQVQRDSQRAASTLGEYIEYAKARTTERQLGKMLNIQNAD